MSIGQLLGGAGRVAGGMRAAEDAARRSQEDQLRLQELNREEDLKRRLASTPMASFNQVAAPQYNPSFTPGQAMPLDVAARANATRVGTAVGAGKATPGTTDGKPVAPTPEMRLSTLSQAEKDRLNLMRVPTAALDVIQAPVAAGLNVVGPLVAGAANVAGRVGNVFAGDGTFKTDNRAPSFSLTPFYDKYVRQVEADNTVVIPGTPGTPATPTSTDRAALATAQRRAESNFNPNAVSPVGATGEMQVMPATAMKPGFGMPTVFQFARQMGVAVGKETEAEAKRLLKDPNVGGAYGDLYTDAMSQKYGGNTDYILAAYNWGPGNTDKWIAEGADPAKLPAETRNYITKIKGELGQAPQVGAQAAPPQPLEVPRTQARNMEMAEFYLSQPDSVPLELQRVQETTQAQMELLTRQRNEAAQLAQMYMQSGTSQGISAAMQIRESINQMDAGMLQLRTQAQEKETYLQGMQGLRELATANDPRRLSGVLTAFMGVPVGIQPRSDGNYNYFVNGKRVREKVSPAELASMALREFSPEARAASSASAAMENELALKQKYGDATVNALRDVQKAIIDGEYKLAEKAAEANNGKLTVDTSNGVAYFQRGGQVFIVNPNGGVEETDAGTVQLPPQARPVVGLNLGR